MLSLSFKPDLNWWKVKLDYLCVVGGRLENRTVSSDAWRSWGSKWTEKESEGRCKWIGVGVADCLAAVQGDSLVTVLIPAPKLIQLTWREKFQRDHFHGKQSCVRSGASAMRVSWGPWAQLPKVKVQSWICRYSYSCQQYCGVMKHIVPEQGSSVDINATWPREPLVLRVQLCYLSSWVSTGLWPSLTPAQWKASLKGTWILISLQALWQRWVFSST